MSCSSVAIRPWSLAIALLVAISGARSSTASDAPEPEDPVQVRESRVLLERMSQAQRNVEYEGTLVYLHGHQLATLRIVHRIDNGDSMESLLALSGPIRAVARNERGVTCMLSDAHAFSLPRGQGGGGVLRAGPVKFERIRQHYLLHVLGQSRIAGRDTDVVGILPRDDYRYGYRYFVDQKSGLPLKMDLMDTAAEPIEQVMFTSVEIFPPDSARMPSASLSDLLPAGEPPADQARERGAIDGDRSRSEQTVGWTLTKMPPGFAVITTGRNGAMEHLVVGDGMVSVSVYVEPVVDSGESGLIGATRMGAITAIGSRIDDYHVTVVGEVPEQTARMLLKGLAPPGTAVGNR